MNGDERPWEKYADPTPPVTTTTGEERPWEKYADPTVVTTGASERAPAAITVRPQGVEPQPGDVSESTMLPPQSPTPSWWQGSADFVRSLPRGVLGGLMSAATAGAQAEAHSMGQPELAAEIPSHEQARAAIEANVTGPTYQPQGTWGQYGEAVGAALGNPATWVAPGAGAASRIAGAVIPALTSETAGQFTKGTAAEPVARFMGAILGAPLGAKLITPARPPTAEWARNAALLEREGIPLSAGDRTGSNVMRIMESVAGEMPFSSSKAQAAKQAQAATVDRYFTGKAFDPAELTARGLPAEAALPQQNVMAAGRQSLSDKYNDLARANTLKSDPKLQRDMVVPQLWYEKNTLPSQRAQGARDIETIRNEIVDRLVAGQGHMPGDTYQSIRSRLGEQANTAYKTDATLGTALKGMRNALDNAMARGLSPQDKQAWALNNQRWANMKQLEQASATAGEHLSPAGIAQSVRSGRAGQYAQGKGGMDEVARAAHMVLKPLPNSYTSVRTGYKDLFNVPNLATTGAVGAGAGALGLGPLGVLGAMALPHVASRAAISAPVQAYFGNRVLPQNMRDILTQAMLQQSASQPSMLERNAADRAAYERKRQDDRRKMGLQ